MENKCRIVLARPKEWVNRMRSFSILVDGNKVTSIASGGSQELWIEPGAHTLSAKVNWCSSRDYPLQLEPGKTIYVRIKNGMKYYLPLVIPMIAALLVNMYYISSDVVKPDWFQYVLVAGILPAALYLVYYITIGRKDYIVIENDPTFSVS
jgi:hypothetical protein